MAFFLFVYYLLLLCDMLLEEKKMIKDCLRKNEENTRKAKHPAIYHRIIRVFLQHRLLYDSAFFFAV